MGRNEYQLLVPSYSCYVLGTYSARDPEKLRQRLIRAPVLAGEKGVLLGRSCEILLFMVGFPHIWREP